MDSQDNSSSFANKLINESSPYLLQHSHNPVDWYPWGPEALDKAKKENKLIIISIGYAACHWCHVMAHESFEDTEAARYMNEHFVSIKVDREERPDVDQIYMNAVQLLTGRGGWPLNVIALPDGRPLYGGTYFPKDEWLYVLEKVLEFARQNSDKAEEQAKDITYGVRSADIFIPASDKPEFTIDDLRIIFRNWRNSLDPINGGYAGAPKFPLPVGFQFLLHYSYLSEDKDVLNAVKISLNKMANGGIYDHIGGGFARYSTDTLWKVPHFEKMLYDNAQLVSLYSLAYQVTKDPLYKKVVYETHQFLLRELTSEEGAFYSSIDADSEGQEGKFYIWTQREIKEKFPEDASIIIDYFNVSKEGNWENGKNVLYSEGSSAGTARKHDISEEELSSRISFLKKEMFRERVKRVFPGTDTKIITAWNAMMIKGYIDAYRVFNDQEFLSAALANAAFIIEKMKADDQRLDRIFNNNKSTVNAFLDDYAFTIEAFISLYQATFDEEWLSAARDMTIYVIEHFYNRESGMFYYTSDIDPQLIARKMEISDNVVPSSNSTMARNLFIIGTFFYNEDYINKATLMTKNVREDALKNGVYYANWDIVMAWLAVPPDEVAVVGSEYLTILDEFNKHYLPNVLFCGGEDEGILLPLLKNKLIPGQTTIYVCKEKTCKMPVTYAYAALEQIRSLPEADSSS